MIFYKSQAEQAKSNTLIEIAKNAILKGADDHFIADIIGLTFEQIQVLRAENK